MATSSSSAGALPPPPGVFASSSSAAALPPTGAFASSSSAATSATTVPLGAGYHTELTEREKEIQICATRISTLIELITKMEPAIIPEIQRDPVTSDGDISLSSGYTVIPTRLESTIRWNGTNNNNKTFNDSLSKIISTIDANLIQIRKLAGKEVFLTRILQQTDLDKKVKYFWDNEVEMRDKLDQKGSIEILGMRVWTHKHRGKSDHPGKQRFLTFSSVITRVGRMIGEAPGDESRRIRKIQEKLDDPETFVKSFNKFFNMAGSLKKDDSIHFDDAVSFIVNGVLKNHLAIEGDALREQEQRFIDFTSSEEMTGMSVKAILMHFSAIEGHLGIIELLHRNVYSAY